MTTPTAAGASILTATIHELTNGRWFADVEIDTSVVPSGTITLDLGAGGSFVGTVARADTHSGKARARVVAGQDGIGSLVKAKAYRQTTMGVILDDLARDTGEIILSSTELRASYTQLWHRSRGSGANALRAAVAHLGATWRFQRDGQLWIGADAWEDLPVDGVEIDSHEGEGWVLYAPHDAPTLRPGYTVDGRRVDAVVTLLRGGSLSQRVLYRKDDSTPILDRLRDGLAEVVNALLGRSSVSRARWDYLALYPCTVDAQAGDGTLDLRPDDVVISGSGLSGIPLRIGLPGWTVEVPAGTRVLLGFEGGDPARPYALQWEHDGAVAELAFDGGTRAVARVDDSIQAGYLLFDPLIPTLYWAPDIGGIPGVYTPVLVTVGPPIPGAPGTALTGDVTSGNGKLLA